MSLEQTPPYIDRGEGNYLRPVEHERIPGELLACSQWVCWRYIDRGNKKPDKQPVNPRTLGSAGVHWENTWDSFEHAFSTYTMRQGRGIDGIGFVLTPNDPFVGVDVDDCVAEEVVSPPAQEILGHLRSYGELSPSGRGLRILLACPEFSKNVRTPTLEVYSHSRFLTITGHHLSYTPPTISIVSTQDIQVILPEQQEHQSAIAPQMRPSAADDDALALWKRIFDHDQYGAQHLRRFQGDTSLDRNDHSFTVIRLLNAIARWTQGDAAKMREMMLLSQLANEKWFSQRGKGDWLDHQIADAIAYVKKGK